ncbi:MAG: FAD-binding protein, partial [Armatimonadota bacterium]
MRSAVNFSGFCAAAKAVGTECLERALGESFRGRVSRGEPLSRHTSYRIGGPADLFLEPVDRESLILAVRRARELGIPPLVIGFGTNLLVSDRGFRGVVISTKRALLGIRFEGTEAVAGAGEGIARLARACARRGMAGLEGLGGVPGSVGGAIVMNAGAFGCEIAGCLKAAEVLHGEGSIATVSADQLGLGYRTSKLSKAAVILSARFELGEGDPKQLVRRLWELEIIRRRSQPVGLPSAGCVFRNPPGNSAGRLI